MQRFLHFFVALALLVASQFWVAAGQAASSTASPTAPVLTCQSPVYQDDASGALLEMRSATPDNGQVRYEIDYLNQGLFTPSELVPLTGTVPQGSTYSTQHSWVTAGQKTVTVRAVNLQGDVSATTSCQVEVRSKPTVSVSLSLKINGQADSLLVADLGSGAVASTLTAAWEKQGTVTNCSGRRLYPGQGTSPWDVTSPYADSASTATLTAGFAAGELTTPYTAVFRLQCQDATGVTLSSSVKTTFSRTATDASPATRVLLDTIRGGGGGNEGGGGGGTVEKGEFCE